LLLGSRSKSRSQKELETTQLETTLFPTIQTIPTISNEEKEITNVVYIKNKLNGLSNRFTGFEEELHISKNVNKKSTKK
jgi:hypothetical protein